MAVAVVVSVSFSHGFLRRGFEASVPCPSRTVFGMSFIPGMGWPVVMRSTMWAKEVGYGAAGSGAVGVVVEASEATEGAVEGVVVPFVEVEWVER